MTDFHRGDLVRLKYGHTRMIVIGARSRLVKAVYTGHDLQPLGHYSTEWGVEKTDFRSTNDFVHWSGTTHTMPKRTKRWHKENNKTLEGENTMAHGYINDKKKLYTFKGLHGEEQYGHDIGRNSKSQIVIEIKGSCEVRAFNPSDLTEVCPYTFKVQALGHRARNEPAYYCHYECTEGQVAVDQVLMSKSGNLYVVVAIDTKNPNPKALFKGHKVPLVPFA